MTNSSLCPKPKGTLSWSCTSRNLLMWKTEHSYRVSSYRWQRQGHVLQHRAVHHTEVQLHTGIKNNFDCFLFWAMAAKAKMWDWTIRGKISRKILKNSLPGKPCNWEVGNTLWQVHGVRGAITFFSSLFLYILKSSALPMTKHLDLSHLIT